MQTYTLCFIDGNKNNLNGRKVLSICLITKSGAKQRKAKKLIQGSVVFILALNNCKGCKNMIILL